jgi:iron complex outermembrane receptor protein
MTVSAIPIPALRIDANASLMRVQFDELIEAGGANRSGNVPANVPERTAGLWATYRFTAWPLTVAAGVHGRGRFFTNNANTTRVGSYAVLDAQASWRVGSGDVTVRGKNLTDTFYADWAWTANQVLVGMPRMIEATYQFRF